MNTLKKKKERKYKCERVIGWKAVERCGVMGETGAGSTAQGLLSISRNEMGS